MLFICSFTQISAYLLGCGPPFWAERTQQRQNRHKTCLRGIDSEQQRRCYGFQLVVSVMDKNQLREQSRKHGGDGRGDMLGRVVRWRRGYLGESALSWSWEELRTVPQTVWRVTQPLGGGLLRPFRDTTQPDCLHPRDGTSHLLSSLTCLA